MNDKPELRAKVVVSFNMSTTGKGEGYHVSVTDEATREDIDRAVEMAARARLRALETLGRVCCHDSEDDLVTVEAMSERTVSV
jgi:hypothetical protein